MKKISITIPLSPECIVAARLSAGSVAKILRLDIDDAEDLKLLVSEGCGVLYAEKFEGCEVCFDWSDGIEITFVGIEGETAPVFVEEDLSVSLMILEGICDGMIADRSDVIRKIVVKKSYQ